VKVEELKKWDDRIKAYESLKLWDMTISGTEIKAILSHIRKLEGEVKRQEEFISDNIGGVRYLNWKELQTQNELTQTALDFRLVEIEKLKARNEKYREALEHTKDRLYKQCSVVKYKTQNCINCVCVLIVISKKNSFKSWSGNERNK